MHSTGLPKSDQQYIRSARQKAKKPEEEFLYATTASKRAERQRLVRFIRSVARLAARNNSCTMTAGREDSLQWLCMTLSVISLSLRPTPYCPDCPHLQATRMAVPLLTYP